MKILVLNAGSSSQKSRLYQVQDSLPEQPPAPLWAADAEVVGQGAEGTLKVTTAQGESLEEKIQASSHEEAIRHSLNTLWSGKTQIMANPSEIDVVGHRIVHGGREHTSSVVITPEVKEAIKRASAFAPLHNPINLQGIETVEHMLPQVRQVAVFDTAFHSHMPQAAAVYPGPYAWFEQGIRRYGFHGISHQYCAQRAAQILNRELADLRLITCHLGNGCSLAAIRGGQSIDTTMGFTPVEGLMMGSRSGSVDPGILTYLGREKDYTAVQLDQLLNKESGLKGVSGVSSDMRAVLAAIQGGNERARLAFDIYVHRLRSYIGAMLATLGGADALVFAGGVGEHAPSIRWAACKAFGFIGLKLDAQKNAHAAADQDIASSDSTVRVLVVQTQEDWSIAKECWRLTRSTS
ncbi:MAG: acetate kinase [Ktedonobacteraceae bacterium]